jgi:SPP1 gp7 family putative phage head morphogenesis protein
VRRLVSLSEAAGAAEELFAALTGITIQKATDPLTPAGYLLISEQVAKRLARAAAGAEAEAIADVIDELGFDWAELSPAAAVAAMKAVNTAIADSYTKRVLPKISDILQVEGPRVMRGTKSSVIARERIKIATSLSQRDLKAEEALRTSQLNFIRNSAGERADALSQKARELVAAAMAKGLGTDKIGQDLADFFEADIPRPESYWKVVADSFVNRARTASQIYSYAEVGIETFELVAVLDEVTTDICRMLDGKTFSVATAGKLLDSLADLDDPEKVKYAQPWVRKGKDENGHTHLYVPHADGTLTSIAKIDRSGVGSLNDRGTYSKALSEAELAGLGVLIPPFHGRCRTTLVAGAEE